ncbi:FAD-binding oxidoreductase, partial [Tahibacter caeni]|uniref:FAD-binding oxidoreductase n=1 Tax=Tahibacter caeni TaxID=1453545 RepID=UPI0021492A4C
MSGTSWGRYPPPRDQRLWMLRDRDAPLPDFSGTALPHGNGRSYGDSCLNSGGNLLCTRGLDRFIAFDAERGVLRCEAGVLLGEILDLVVGQGWFLPVTPGTKYVTVGGAIANDVHGKNHHVNGCFSEHVNGFELLRSDGSRRWCSAQENADWFAATAGGLGLTGLITWAELRLQRVRGPWLNAETHRFGSLAEFFALSAAAERDYEYTVAWIDCAARGAAAGRGHFICANHAP